MRYTDVAAPYEELYDIRKNLIETVNLIGNPEYRRQHELLTTTPCITKEIAPLM